ncbi:hypothetical protein ACFOUP_05375 [Belliella kenyensis]|uniref:Glycosyltransferase RgtA/B/C/D-like domain-containing protein n=1 Tax=Belliella kenyensis TaxID=1472724 RepID=A0ABV8EIS9_9BACT|nr:hypothetical protein [Belliella kenyensis]MCH7402725.1 hypothetical protein [Belliella kenyensis]MDN3603727.1 hypothetical protein [Belliella kenyensis]
MKSKKLLYFFSWLALSSGYLVLSYWLQQRGFFNLESYFIDYKKLVTSLYEESILRSVYFTDPFLLYLGSSLFGFPKVMGSTYFFNALVIGGLSNHLLYKTINSPKIPNFLVVYIFFSPIIIYAGISGGSLALYLLFYYLFFTLVLKYTETYSVFHLTLLSILIGVFILLNLEVLKLLLLLIPIFFFSSFHKAKGISGSFYNRASLILSNDSQRRKFFSSFFSSIFVVSFIPLMGLATFLILNKIFAGNTFYFLESYGNNWNSYSPNFVFIKDVEAYSPFIASNTPFYLISFFSVSVLTIFQIFNYGGAKAKSILMLLSILFLLSEIQEFKIEKLNIQYLSMLTGAGLASALFFRKDSLKLNRFNYILVSLFAMLGMYFQWQYFNISIQENENLYAKSLVEAVESKRVNSIQNFEQTFKKLSPGRILIDDAIFYPELTTLSKEFIWEGHFSSSYQQALQIPELYADYVVMTKSNHPLFLDDVVATAFKRLEMLQVQSDLNLLFEDDFLEIYQINPNSIVNK